MKAGTSGEMVDLAEHADARKCDYTQQMKHDSFVVSQGYNPGHTSMIPQQRSEVDGATAHHDVTMTPVSHGQEKQISGLRRLVFSLNSD